MTWQLIDTAPKDGTPVDLWMVDRIAGIEWREVDAEFAYGRWQTMSEEGGYEAVGLPGIQDPTHWMPPPKPPGS